MDDLKKQYSEYDDYMLLKIAYFASSEYSDDAITAAKSVLSERGLSRPSEEILQKAKLLEASGFEKLEDEVFKQCFLCQSSIEIRESPYVYTDSFHGLLFGGITDRNLRNLLIVCQSCKPYILTYPAQKFLTQKVDGEVVIDTYDKKNLIQYVHREYGSTNKPVILNAKVIGEVTGKKMVHTKYK